MKKNDKMLVGIVIGIILLVVVALVTTLAKPEPTYQTEESPEGVAHNYILAIQKEEFERAYSYLSTSLEGYPKSLRKFEDDLLEKAWRYRWDNDSTVTLGEATITRKRAVIEITESYFYGGGLFDSSQSINTFDMDLQLDNEEWKIIDSGSYFYRCWEDLSGHSCDE